MASITPNPRKPYAGKCPICGAPGEHEYRPFCSRRCADVDLSRWLRGAYAIAGGKEDADEDGEDTALGRRDGANEQGRSPHDGDEPA